MRAFRRYCEANQALTDFPFLPDAHNKDALKPSYAFAGGRLPMMAEEDGETHYNLPWASLEAASWDVLVGKKAAKAPLRGTLGSKHANLFRVMSLGESVMSTWTFRVDPERFPPPPVLPWEVALAGTICEHPGVQAAVDAASGWEPELVSEFSFPIEWLEAEPRIRRLKDASGKTRGTMVGFAARADSQQLPGYGPDGDRVISFVAWDEDPVGMELLQHFLWTYRHIYAKYVEATRGKPFMVTPRPKHTFASVHDWVDVDVKALPPASGKSIPAEAMREMHLGLLRRVGLCGLGGGAVATADEDAGEDLGSFGEGLSMLLRELRERSEEDAEDGAEPDGASSASKEPDQVSAGHDSDAAPAFDFGGRPLHWMHLVSACLLDGAEQDPRISKALVGDQPHEAFVAELSICRESCRIVAANRSLGDLELVLHEALMAEAGLRELFQADLAKLVALDSAKRCLRHEVVAQLTAIMRGSAGLAPVGAMGRLGVLPSLAPLFTSDELAHMETEAAKVAAHCFAPPEQLPDGVRFSEHRPIFSVPYVSQDLLLAIDRATGTRDSVPIAVVPRVYVLDREVLSMMMAERHEFRLRPTPLIATKTHLCWVIHGKVKALSYLDDMPDWAELFGRGPLAAFGHADLGLAAKDGVPDCLDLFMMPEQAIPQTSFGYQGLPRSLLFSGSMKVARAAYAGQPMLERCEARADALQSFLGDQMKAGRHVDGFFDDLHGIYMFVASFLAQGGFSAFLPRGLDPMGYEDFRYPSMKFSSEMIGHSDPQEKDPTGEPLETLAGRRGLTVPMFLEAHGTDEAGAMSSFLRVLERLWPEVRAQRRQAKGTAVPTALQPQIASLAQRAQWQAEWEQAAAAVEGSAMVKAEAVVKSHPANPAAWFAYGHALRAAKRPEDAVRALEQSMDLDARPWTLWIMAMTYDDMGREEDKQRCLLQAEDLPGDMPGSVRVRQRLARFRSTEWLQGVSKEDLLRRCEVAMQLTPQDHADNREAMRNFLSAILMNPASTRKVRTITQQTLTDFPDSDWAWEGYLTSRLSGASAEERRELAERVQRVLGAELTGNLIWSKGQPLLCPIDGKPIPAMAKGKYTFYSARYGEVVAPTKDVLALGWIKCCSEPCADVWAREGQSRIAALRKAATESGAND